MSMSRVMARAMAGGEVKVIPKQCAGQINRYVEWLKWLSYESPYEKQIMNFMDGQNFSDASYELLREVSRIRRNRMFADLFKKYGVIGCSEEEYMMVYDYMCTESIEKLMMSKLSSEELATARDRIIDWSQQPKEVLSQKVKEEQQEDVYAQLSMVDSYVLHMISQIDFARSMENLNREIAAQMNSNNAMYQKCFYYASKPYFEK